MKAYYNEFDTYAAAWLRNLISAGHIAPGDVDERSIADVRPDELRRYTQCHFFAGIGVWSYALRRAGWADDRPVWTGSCPCQPFSAAGKGGGFDDERHLWPHFHWLISQCRPAVVLGEQVASKDGLAWLDLVQADLEGTGYAAGAVDLCAAGVGAPHIRQRLWWVGERLADASGSRLERQDARALGVERAAVERDRWDGGLGHADSVDARGNSGNGAGAETRGSRGGPLDGHFGDGADVAGGLGRLADADGRQRDGLAELRGPLGNGQDAGRPQGGGEPGARRDDGGLGDAHGLGQGTLGRVSAGPGAFGEGDVLPQGGGRPGPTNGLWRAADWLFCRDGKWRPVEPGTFPLAHGAAARVGRLRGYGNAINAEAAVAFISCLDR